MSLNKFMKTLGVLGLTCMLTFGSTLANASTIQKNDTDKILLNSGVPNDVLSEMSTELKSVMAEKCVSENATFGTYETKYFNVDSNNNLVPVTRVKRGTIPKADLKLTGSTLYSQTSDVNVFGEFEWIKAPIPGVGNDAFGITIPEGWDINAGSEWAETYRKAGWVSDSSWYTVGDCGGRPYEGSFGGFVWKNLNGEFGNAGSWNYKGVGSFKMTKSSSSAPRKFSLAYIRDTSKKSDATYGINIYWLSIQTNPSSGSLDKAFQVIGF